MYIPALAWSFEDVLSLVQCPDPRERCIEMANQGLGTSPQTIGQSGALRHGDGNIPGQQPKAILFGEHFC